MTRRRRSALPRPEAQPEIVVTEASMEASVAAKRFDWSVDLDVAGPELRAYAAAKLKCELPPEAKVEVSVRIAGYDSVAEAILFTVLIPEDDACSS